MTKEKKKKRKKEKKKSDEFKQRLIFENRIEHQKQLEKKTKKERQLSPVNPLVKTRSFTKNDKKMKLKTISSLAFDCAKLWNSFYLTRRHKLDSDVLVRLSVTLRSLTQGTFVQRYGMNERLQKQIPDFFKDRRNKNRKFTKSEIKDTIKTMILYYNVNYLPANKKYVPRDIDRMFYNPNTQYSYFLLAFAKGNATPAKKVRDSYPSIRGYFEHKRNIPLDDHDKNAISYCLNELEVYYRDSMRNKNDSYSVSKHFGSFETMCRTFIEWLDKDVNRSLKREYKDNLFIFRPASVLFKKFLRYYEDVLQVKLRPISEYEFDKMEKPRVKR